MAILYARVYVGTYGKYNDGNLDGDWLELSDYSDRDAFHEACHQLHGDEEHPELMFQAWEEIPDGLITESGISEGVWDLIGLYLDNGTEDALTAFVESGYATWDDVTVAYRKYQDAYVGDYAKEKDFANQLAEENGFYRGMESVGISRYYFDLDAYAHDLFEEGYWFSDGKVYRK